MLTASEHHLRGPKLFCPPLLKPFEACFEEWVRVLLLSELLMDIEPYHHARLRTGEVHVYRPVFVHGRPLYDQRHRRVRADFLQRKMV